MKILHLTTHLNIGGIARYVTNLSKSLGKKGHTIFVASSGGELEKTLEDTGVKHIYLGIKTKSELSPKIIKSSLTLNSFLKNEEIDLIHAHTRVTQVLAAILSYFHGLPYVTTCHGFFKKRLGRRLFGCWGKKAIAISEAVRGQLIRDFGLDEDRVVLIHTGIETSKFMREIPDTGRDNMRRRWNIDRAPVIGTIGRLSPVKGQDVLLRAAKELLKDFSDMKILLVGDGPFERRLKEVSSDLGLEKNVVFAGTVEDTIEALSAMDVFVLPSIKEGLGLSLIEAMAFGVPSIASRVGGIENLIDDGVSGILVAPGNPHELACAVKYLLNSKEKMERFKAEGKKKAISEFDIDKMVSKIEEMYREILQKRT